MPNGLSAPLVYEFVLRRVLYAPFEKQQKFYVFGKESRIACNYDNEVFAVFIRFRCFEMQTHQLIHLIILWNAFGGLNIPMNILLMLHKEELQW